MKMTTRGDSIMTKHEKTRSKAERSKKAGLTGKSIGFGKLRNPGLKNSLLALFSGSYEVHPSPNHPEKTTPSVRLGGLFPSNKRALIPLFALFFTPIGLVIFLTLAIIALALLGFGFFLALNILSVTGFLLVILAAALMLKGMVNRITIALLITGLFVLIIPMINNGLKNLTLGVII